jgi:hypothetical protein
MLHTSQLCDAGAAVIICYLCMCYGLVQGTPRQGSYLVGVARLLGTMDVAAFLDDLYHKETLCQRGTAACMIKLKSVCMQIVRAVCHV